MEGECAVSSDTGLNAVTMDGCLKILIVVA